MAHKFLTPEWVEEAKKVRESFADRTPKPTHAVKMNLNITEAPAEVSASDIAAHMDSSGEELKMDLGHLDDPELTVTVDYPTAKAIFVDGNPQAGMQAFMAGKIKVQGDMTKLMAMQSSPVDPVALEIAGKIKEITAD